MSDYISREAVNALIKAECSPKVAAYLIDVVATIPAADVRPVVRGKWIVDGHHIICSACNEYLCIKDEEHNEIPREFCPNCGADMREES